MGALFHHQIHAHYGRAGRPARGRQRVRRHHRIALVQADHFVPSGRAGFDPVDMRLVMHPRELRAIGQRRVEVLHHGIQSRRNQAVFDRCQAIGRFRVVGGDPVKGAVRMTDECKCHGAIVLDCSW